MRPIGLSFHSALLPTSASIPLEDRYQDFSLEAGLWVFCGGRLWWWLRVNWRINQLPSRGQQTLIARAPYPRPPYTPKFLHSQAQPPHPFHYFPKHLYILTNAISLLPQAPYPDSIRTFSDAPFPPCPDPFSPHYWPLILLGPFLSHIFTKNFVRHCHALQLLKRVL